MIRDRFSVPSGILRWATPVAMAAALSIVMASPAAAFGTFRAKTTYRTGVTPYRLGVADLDGDHHSDILVANCGQRYVSVLWNKGNGTFKTPATKLAVAGSGGPGPCPDGVAFGDFNKDGKLDFAVADYGTGQVSVFLNAGNRHFRPHADYPTVTGPSPIAAADFNHDGTLDLAVASYSDHAVALMLGQAHGTFAGPSATQQVGTNPDFILAGDYNGDHKTDIVTANTGSSALSLVTGNNDGTLNPATSPSVCANVSGLASGDFNHDGKVDLAVSCDGAVHGVQVVLGNGAGTFAAPITTPLPAAAHPQGLAAGDFNRDGKLDLAAACNGSGLVAILKGSGNGHFHTPAAIYAAGQGPDFVVAAKLNADAGLDLVVDDVLGGGASVLLNKP